MWHPSKRGVYKWINITSESEQWLQKNLKELKVTTFTNKMHSHFRWLNHKNFIVKRFENITWYFNYFLGQQLLLIIKMINNILPIELKNNNFVTLYWLWNYQLQLEWD